MRDKIVIALIVAAATGFGILLGQGGVRRAEAGVTGSGLVQLPRVVQGRPPVPPPPVNIPLGGLAGGVSSSPAIGADGTVYVLWSGTSATEPTSLNCETEAYSKSIGSTLYAFSPAGAVLWSVELDGQALATSPAIAADGTIYVGTAGKIWAYDCWLSEATETSSSFYAIDPSGAIKWRAHRGNHVY